MRYTKKAGSEIERRTSRKLGLFTKISLSAVSRDNCSTRCHGWASISVGVQRGMGTTKIHRIARLSLLYHGFNVRTKMFGSITWVSGWLQQQNLEPVYFKSGYMKSAVVCAGGTESCIEQRFRGQRGRLPVVSSG
jgi:hypothetical protein